MFHAVGGVEVEEGCGAVVLEANLAGVFLLAPGWIDEAVVENVGERAAHGFGHGLHDGDAAVRRFSAAGDFVVVNVDLLDKAVIALVFGFEDLLGDGRGSSFLNAVADAGLVVDQEDVDGVVVLNFVFEDFDILDGHDVDAGSSGEIVNGAEAFGCEVGCVVVNDLIVVDPDVFAALTRKIGEIEDADAAGVVGHDVVVDVGVFGVFDLESVDVVFGAIAAEDDVFGLADVNACIGGAACDGIFDEKIFAFDGIDGVGAVVFVGAAGPFRADTANDDVGAALDGQAIACGVFDANIFDGEVVGFDEEALCACFLTREGEYGFVHAFAAKRNFVDGERKRAIKMEFSFGKFDN